MKSLFRLRDESSGTVSRLVRDENSWIVKDERWNVSWRVSHKSGETGWSGSAEDSWSVCPISRRNTRWRIKISDVTGESSWSVTETESKNTSNLTLFCVISLRMNYRGQVRQHLDDNLCRSLMNFIWKKLNYFYSLHFMPLTRHGNGHKRVPALMPPRQSTICLLGK